LLLRRSAVDAAVAFGAGARAPWGCTFNVEQFLVPPTGLVETAGSRPQRQRVSINGRLLYGLTVTGSPVVLGEAFDGRYCGGPQAESRRIRGAVSGAGTSWATRDLGSYHGG